VLFDCPVSIPHRKVTQPGAFVGVPQPSSLAYKGHLVICKKDFDAVAESVLCR